MKLYEYKQGQINEVKTIINNNNGKYIYIINCPKCNGYGKLDIFNHIQDGICFKCNGRGTIEKQGKLYTLEEATKLQKRYLDKKRKQQEKIIEKQIKEKQDRIREQQEKVKKEKEQYKQTKKITKKEKINIMLNDADVEELKYYIGNMNEEQIIFYINLLIEEEGKIKASIKRSIKGNFADNKKVLDLL